MSQPSAQPHLATLTRPWVSLLVFKRGQRTDRLLAAPEGCVSVTVNGRKCATAPGFFKEMARAFKFPDYFGHNWDALEECLLDLEWFPAKGYVLIITDAEGLLPVPRDYGTFLNLLKQVGSAWAGGQCGAASGQRIPFHTVLTVSADNKTERASWKVPTYPVRRPSSARSRRRTPHTTR